MSHPTQEAFPGLGGLPSRLSRAAVELATGLRCTCSTASPRDCDLHGYDACNMAEDAGAAEHLAIIEKEVAAHLLRAHNDIEELDLIKDIEGGDSVADAVEERLKEMPEDTRKHADLVERPSLRGRP